MTGGLWMRVGLVLGLTAVVGVVLGFVIGIRLVSAEVVDTVIDPPGTPEPTYSTVPFVRSAPDTAFTASRVRRVT
jgi:hypothetical protein